MPPDDAVAAAAAQREILEALDAQLSDPADRGSLPLTRTVVAGPSDDARELAHREILAALFGGPAPGGF